MLFGIMPTFETKTRKSRYQQFNMHFTRYTWPPENAFEMQDLGSPPVFKNTN